MRLGTVCVVALSGLAVMVADAAPRHPALDAVHERVVEVLHAPGRADDAKAVADQLQVISDQIVLKADDRDIVAMIEPELLRRFLDDAAGTRRDREALALAENNPRLAMAMALLMRREPMLDDRVSAYSMAIQLQAQRPEETAEAPDLAAAVAAVHDNPGGFRLRLNENMVVAPEAIEVFDYFYDARKRLVVDPTEAAAELLTFVVDVTSTPKLLGWARNSYGGNPNPGTCFFEIVYDYDHLLGKPKKVTVHGNYNISNVKQYGGVCIDQAYYASEVGKASGIPTAILSARGAEMGHAWIGYLETRRSPTWNLDAGRYDAYQGLRGNVDDPVTHRTISDADLNLLSTAVKTPWEDRAFGGAMGMVAERWGFTKPKPEGDLPQGIRAAKEPRGTTLDDRLSVLQQGLEASPYDAQTWDVFVGMVDKGELSEKQINEWAEVLDTLCGTRFPDFSVKTLERIIPTFDDPQRESDIWDWALTKFSKRRPDIAAEIRFHQAEIWLEAGNKDFAWRAYQDVTTRYGKEGTYLVEALRRMVRMLDDDGKVNEQIPLLQQAWRRVPKPSAKGSFVKGGNWYRIGSMLEEEFRKRGMTRQMQDVRKQLDSVEA